LSKIGWKYWVNFKKSNKDKIVTRRGKKIELQRQEWNTYSNFENMYSFIADETVDCGIARILESPQWQDENGLEVTEDHYGCKVTHNIKNPTSSSITGEPVICIVIFSGIKRVSLLETGMDMNVIPVGDCNQPDFFANNSGVGKLYPGGPTCIFKGKIVPCLCRFTPSGSVDG